MIKKNLSNFWLKIECDISLEKEKLTSINKKLKE